MRPFHMVMKNSTDTRPRRVDFHAESPDHAFQIARNEADGVHVELWEGAKLLARMTKSGANMWKLLPTTDLPGATERQPMAPPAATA